MKKSLLRKGLMAGILAVTLIAASGCVGFRTASQPGSSEETSGSGMKELVIEKESETVNPSSEAIETIPAGIPMETAAASTEAAPEATAATAATPEETTEATYGRTLVDETVYSTSSDVNIRTRPDTQSDVVGQLKNGQELRRLAILDNGWSVIDYEGEERYVYSDYLTTETPPETTAAPEPVSHGQSAGTGIYYAGSGPLVAIDAGHQLYGDYNKEPNAPGSSTMKARVTSGTQGISSGVTEYQLNLDVSLKLRDALIAQGYSVLMIRETNDVSISNDERATLANDYGADIFLRIHANGADDTSISGTLAMAPSSSNPYVGGLAASSQTLSALIVDAMCAHTGFVNRGVQITDTMTGINWCQMPVSIIEMGFMTNGSEDWAMQDPAVQDQMVAGIVEGVNAYFGR